jgi:hypothetical protein
MKKAKERKEKKKKKEKGLGQQQAARQAGRWGQTLAGPLRLPGRPVTRLVGPLRLLGWLGRLCMQASIARRPREQVLDRQQQ